MAYRSPREVLAGSSPASICRPISSIAPGAASGIGRATATRLHRAGAKLMLVDVDQTAVDNVGDALGGRGDEVCCRRCDVRDAAEVQAVVACCTDLFGRLDGAVNSAGIIGARALIVDYPDETFADVLGVNVVGLFNSLKAQLSPIGRQGSGSIVNLSSAAGLRGTPFVSAYAASKHAVIGLTRSVALEYGGRGVRVNAVCPGLTRTSMTATFSSDNTAGLLARVPVGRLAEPEEIADTIGWLLSDLSSFVTGAAITADGGFTAG